MGRFNIEDRKVITSVDLGTSSIKCVIGVFSSNKMEIVGTTQVPYRGLNKGRIVNMKETAEAIRQACEEAEVTASMPISQLFLGLGGDYHVFSSQGMSIISSGQVTVEDVNQAVATAKAVALRSGHRLLHVLPKSFTVDREGPFFNPLGLSGLRLETETLMVSIPNTSVQNALQCLRYAGYSARGLVLQPLASTLSAIDSIDKKTSGICILDIGQDQTSFVVLMDGRIHDMGILNMGGEDFTHDLMLDLKIPRDQAEEIKINYGKIMLPDTVESPADISQPLSSVPSKIKPAFSALSQNKELSDISPTESTNDSIFLEDDDSYSEKTQQAHQINDILTTRGELLFQELKNKLESLNYLNLIEGGVIITGRGSYLKGLTEMGKLVLEKPVQKNIIPYTDTKNIDNKNDYATAIGILHYVQNEKIIDYRSDSFKGSVFKIKRWMQDLLP